MTQPWQDWAFYFLLLGAVSAWSICGAIRDGFKEVAKAIREKKQ